MSSTNSEVSLYNNDKYKDFYFKGIFETSIAASVFYFLMTIITVVHCFILLKKMFLHHTFKLFMVSIFFEFFSFIFTMADYAQFSSSGVKIRALSITGQVLDEIAQTVLLLLLILLAKGFDVIM